LGTQNIACRNGFGLPKPLLAKTKKTGQGKNKFVFGSLGAKKRN